MLIRRPLFGTINRFQLIGGPYLPLPSLIQNARDIALAVQYPNNLDGLLRRVVDNEVRKNGPEFDSFLGQVLTVMTRLRIFRDKTMPVRNSRIT